MEKNSLKIESAGPRGYKKPILDVFNCNPSGMPFLFEFKMMLQNSNPISCTALKSIPNNILSNSCSKTQRGLSKSGLSALIKVSGSRIDAPATTKAGHLLLKPFLRIKSNMKMNLSERMSSRSAPTAEKALLMRPSLDRGFWAQMCLNVAVKYLKRCESSFGTR